MSPFQHGEVFVTDDGHEGDLDLGHYERFIDAKRLTGATPTSPKALIYQSLIARVSVAAISWVAPCRLFLM